MKMRSFTYDGYFCFRAWSVRTYNALRRAGIQVLNAEDAIRAGDMALHRQIKNAGTMTALELYRGAGLGAIQIEERINDYVFRYMCDRDTPWELETIRRLCEKFDEGFRY